MGKTKSQGKFLPLFAILVANFSEIWRVAVQSPIFAHCPCAFTVNQDGESHWVIHSDALLLQGRETNTVPRQLRFTSNSVVVGALRVSPDLSLSDDTDPMDPGWSCGTCSPTPCPGSCRKTIPGWLDHKKCHKHLKSNRVSGLSCDDNHPCHFCRFQLERDQTGSFRRRVQTLRRDRTQKRQRRKDKKAALRPLRSHSAHESGDGNSASRYSCI